MAVTATYLSTYKTTNKAPADSATRIRLTFARRNQTVICKVGAAGDGRTVTCYYTKAGPLSDAIMANPAGPDGKTLRSHIVEAIASIDKTGAFTPANFVRY